MELKVFSSPESTRATMNVSHDAKLAWPCCSRVVLS